MCLLFAEFVVILHYAVVASFGQIAIKKFAQCLGKSFRLRESQRNINSIHNDETKVKTKLEIYRHD